VRVPYHLALLVPHRLHELHHPYARICKENLEFWLRNEGFGLGLGLGIRVVVPMASFFPARVSTDTRRPTGASSSHRPCTPILDSSGSRLRRFLIFQLLHCRQDLLKDDDRKNDVVGTHIDCTAIKSGFVRKKKKKKNNFKNILEIKICKSG
jgi:hypothetical protein